MKNSAGRCECSYPTKAEFNNIALLFIQNIFFAQTCKLYSPPFLSLLNETVEPCAQVFSVSGSIIFDVNGSIICSVLHF